MTTRIQLQERAESHWVYAFALFLLALSACKVDGGNPSSSASGGQTQAQTAKPDDTNPATCKPKCGADCGVDDGCGAKCGCAEGLECKAGVCIDASCGPCRPKERCADGKCQCVPDCAKRDCQSDGCGGKCPCEKPMVVKGDGESTPPEDCHDTCKGAGWACGDLCGVSCGACGEGEVCHKGNCECAPKCDGTSCSDGCGGSCDCASGTLCNAGDQCVAPELCKDTCASTGLKCGSVCGEACGTCGDGQACMEGQCREAVSCVDCGLQLRLIERRVISDRIVRVKVGVDFKSVGDNSAPRLVDVRVGADHAVSLVEAEAGPALTGTGKALFLDEATNQSWQEKSDDSFQVLAYSVSGTLRVNSGRMMTLTFDLAEPGPVRFAFLRHAQTFAPLDADGVLQSSDYDKGLVVTR